MAKSIEEISRFNTSGGKTDSNLSNDTLHVGGIPADEMATQKYVQDYHGAKEEELKRYIDNQDAQKLQQAKAYTDLVIEQQDFSSFAKTTDVQALDNKLSGELAEGLNTQKGYTDEKVGALASDVNDNFEDVGVAITSLNRTTQELFTSVSNGKSNVAAAITDKGISTASDATFDTMATNIRKIPTSGGDPDPYYVNTGDGTAESNDIMLGKTAYVKGEKIYGSHVDTDTSDATAVASDIRAGKTAYADGSKVYGTLVPETVIEYPTYGTDTSDGTATASDIMYGKTAYARGQKIVGTMRNTDVEEIYGTIKENQFDSYNLDSKDDDVYEIYDYAISKNLDYYVRIVRLSSTDDTDWAVESFPMDSSGIYKEATQNLTSQETTYKKYRYTKAELGIAQDLPYHRFSVSLGAPGINNEANKCLFILRETLVNNDQYSTTAGAKLHFYTYHLTENGVIGQMYSSESDVINNYTYQINALGYSLDVLTSDTKPYELYVFGVRYIGNGVGGYYNYTYHLKLAHQTTITVQETKIDWSNVLRPVMSGDKPSITAKNAHFSADGKYIIGLGMAVAYDIHYRYIIMLDNDGIPKAVCWLTNNIYYSTPTICMIPNTNKAIYMYSTNNNVSKLSIIDLIYNDTPLLSYTTEKTITLNANDLLCLGLSFITLDEEILICLASKLYSTNNMMGYYPKIISFDMDDIINAQDNDTITFLDELYDFGSITSYMYSLTKIDNYAKLFTSFNNSNIIFEFNKNYANMIQADNTENIVGIKYKGEYYHKFKEHMLTAGQPDVDSGKTFIGWQGYPETGTKGE